MPTVPKQITQRISSQNRTRQYQQSINNNNNGRLSGLSHAVVTASAA